MLYVLVIQWIIVECYNIFLQSYFNIHYAHTRRYCDRMLEFWAIFSF